jgi:hypothetical protein
MKLREFYDFAKKVSDHNDLLSSNIQFEIKKDKLNELVDEFNEHFHQELGHINYEWLISLDDEGILPFLEKIGFAGTSWEVCDLVKNDFFAEQEVVGFTTDDYGDGCYTILKMNDELFNEYRNYFVFVDGHGLV